MTRDQLLALFEVDNHDIIQQDGPFKGQPLYVAYFWFLYLSGYIGERGAKTIAFDVRAEDRIQFPVLSAYTTLWVSQEEDGSIRLVSWTLVD